MYKKVKGFRDTFLKIAMVGDVMPGDSHLAIGWRVKSKIKKHGTNFPFLHVSAVLKDADPVIGNLESVISPVHKIIEVL